MKPMPLQSILESAASSSAPNCPFLTQVTTIVQEIQLTKDKLRIVGYSIKKGSDGFKHISAYGNDTIASYLLNADKGNIIAPLGISDDITLTDLSPRYLATTFPNLAVLRIKEPHIYLTSSAEYNHFIFNSGLFDLANHEQGLFRLLPNLAAVSFTVKYPVSNGQVGSVHISIQRDDIISRTENLPLPRPYIRLRSQGQGIPNICEQALMFDLQYKKSLNVIDVDTNIANNPEKINQPAAGNATLNAIKGSDGCMQLSNIANYLLSISRSSPQYVPQQVQPTQPMQWQPTPQPTQRPHVPQPIHRQLAPQATQRPQPVQRQSAPQATQPVQPDFTQEDVAKIPNMSLEAYLKVRLADQDCREQVLAYMTKIETQADNAGTGAFTYPERYSIMVSAMDDYADATRKQAIEQVSSIERDGKEVVTHDVSERQISEFEAYAQEKVAFIQRLIKREKLSSKFTNDEHRGLTQGFAAVKFNITSTESGRETNFIRVARTPFSATFVFNTIGLNPADRSKVLIALTRETGYTQSGNIIENYRNAQGVWAITYITKQHVFADYGEPGTNLIDYPNLGDYTKAYVGFSKTTPSIVLDLLDSQYRIATIAGKSRSGKTCLSHALLIQQICAGICPVFLDWKPEGSVMYIDELNFYGVIRDPEMWTIAAKEEGKHLLNFIQAGALIKAVCAIAAEAYRTGSKAATGGDSASYMDRLDTVDRDKYPMVSFIFDEFERFCRELSTLKSSKRSEDKMEPKELAAHKTYLYVCSALMELASNLLTIANTGVLLYFITQQTVASVAMSGSDGKDWGGGFFFKGMQCLFAGRGITTGQMYNDIACGGTMKSDADKEYVADGRGRFVATGVAEAFRAPRIDNAISRNADGTPKNLELTAPYLLNACLAKLGKTLDTHYDYFANYHNDIVNNTQEYAEALSAIQQGFGGDASSLGNDCSEAFTDMFDEFDDNSNPSTASNDAFGYDTYANPIPHTQPDYTQPDYTQPEHTAYYNEPPIQSETSRVYNGSPQPQRGYNIPLEYKKAYDYIMRLAQQNSDFAAMYGKQGKAQEEMLDYLVCFDENEYGYRVQECHKLILQQAYGSKQTIPAQPANTATPIQFRTVANLSYPYQPSIVHPLEVPFGQRAIQGSPLKIFTVKGFIDTFKPGFRNTSVYRCADYKLKSESMLKTIIANFGGIDKIVTIDITADSVKFNGTTFGCTYEESDGSVSGLTIFPYDFDFRWVKKFPYLGRITVSDPTYYGKMRRMLRFNNEFEFFTFYPYLEVLQVGGNTYNRSAVMGAKENKGRSVAPTVNIKKGFGLLLRNTLRVFGTAIDALRY